MRLIWGQCRCTICFCFNATKNDNHLCGACYHPYDADEVHQGLTQITLKPMASPSPITLFYLKGISI